MSTDFAACPMVQLTYPDGAPNVLHATHEGSFKVLGLKFRVYQLSDGRLVIDSRDMAAFLAPLLDEQPRAGDIDQ